MSVNSLNDFPEPEFGENVTVFPNCVLNRPPMGPVRRTINPQGNCKIGDNTVIGCNVVVYRGVTIGKNCLIGDGAIIRENTTIGDHATVGQYAIVSHDCRIGDRTRIMEMSAVCGYSVIGNDVFIAPGLKTANDPSVGNDPHHLLTITIKDRARIGLNVFILPGITIGEDALVAAGAGVTKDVPDHATVKGIPAKNAQIPPETLLGSHPHPRQTLPQ